MKAALIIICFCLALMTSTVHSDDLPEGAIIVNQMAEKGLNINGVFQPFRGGYLGEGSYGFTFSGRMLHPSPRPVAMKFTLNEDGAAAAREYEMYTYLYAINKPNVERYGIPAVYYYGLWNDYILMAITLLDSTIQRGADRNGLIKPFDIFIMCQEFVRISKYIHGCGVRHNDIKADNIMFRKHQVFIIDFNIGRKIYRSNDINARSAERSLAKDDWLCFLYSMFNFVGIKFEASDMDSSGNIKGADVLRENVTHTIQRIETIAHAGLKRVFLEFAKHVFENEIQRLGLSNMRVNNNGFAFYDQVYQVIQEEMQKIRHGGFVSWLTTQEKLNARNYPPVPISSINDLFVNDSASYPPVNYNIFSRV